MNRPMDKTLSDLLLPSKRWRHCPTNGFRTPGLGFVFVLIPPIVPAIGSPEERQYSFFRSTLCLRTRLWLMSHSITEVSKR